MAERLFSTLECEPLARRRFRSQAEARMACFSCIEGSYNPLRSALGYRSPAVYEQGTKTINRSPAHQGPNPPPNRATHFSEELDLADTCSVTGQ